MTLTNVAQKVIYSGDGANTTFAIPFPELIDSDTEVIVWLRDVSDADPDNHTEVLQTLGVDYSLLPLPAPTNVEMAVAPVGTDRLVIKRVLPLTQTTDYINTSIFPAESHELSMDRLAAIVQQVNERVDRAWKFQESAEYATPQVGQPIDFPNPKQQNLVIWEDAVTPGQLENLTIQELSVLLGPFLGGGGVLGDPTDGVYGVTGCVAGVANGDTVEDAFDKICTFLEGTAPASPPNLSAITLILLNNYSSLRATTAVAVPLTVNDTTPTIETPTPLSVASPLDAATGDLTGLIDAGVVGGPITFTSGDETVTTVGDLTVLDDDDAYAGVPGSTGYWFVFTARIQVSGALALGPHTASMSHTTTGTTPLLNFDVDDSVTPVISNPGATPAGATLDVSGVPNYGVGATITATFDVDNAINSHYNDVRVASASSDVSTGTVNDALPIAPNNDPGDQFNASIVLTVSAGNCVRGVTITQNAYSADPADTATSPNVTSISADGISDESVRFVSGVGQFPAIAAGPVGAGDAFNGSTLLTAVNNEELQMICGVFQYPPLIDYSGDTPAGPDYTGILAGSFNNNRWATFKLGPVTNASNITITVGGAVGWGAGPIVASLEFQVRVDGAIPTAGWLDGNAAYPGVGTPTNDGDPALDFGSSTATSRRVTFGPTVRTGDVYVRVGIPSGDGKTFTSIT